MERKSKYRFYSFSNIREDKGEFNKSPSLVDRSCKIPSLEDVINKYVVNGDSLPRYQFEDDKEEFDVTDYKGFEVEDFRDEALETINNYNLFRNQKKEFRKDVNNSRDVGDVAPSEKETDKSINDSEK